MIPNSIVSSGSTFTSAISSAPLTEPHARITLAYEVNAQNLTNSANLVTNYVDPGRAHVNRIYAVWLT